MEVEIIHIALENLRQTTGIEVFWREIGPREGTMILNINGQEHAFTLVLKNEVRPHQIHQLEEFFHKQQNLMLVANRIFPKAKEELRDKQIPYLEANGNIFLKQGGILLFVDTQKPITTQKTKSNRAFTKTGLKVLFYLLQHNELINLTQRELAGKVDVGLGNIPQVIEGLKETGFLIPLNKREWVWDNRKTLLDRWVTEYGTILKPKLKKERYTFQGNWKEIPFNHELTVWGGEPAADILTNHLRPEKFILYTKENRVNLIKNYRLIPKEDGEIEVLEMFWKQNKPEQTAPAILVYADLLLESGKRNIETAEILLNEQIKPKL
jgi:hypothetical protein